MQQDVPGYALITGGKNNGLYVRDGQYYRLSGGKMFDVDTGAAAASKGAEPAADPRADADARLAAMKAEAAGLSMEGMKQDDQEGAKGDPKADGADQGALPPDEPEGGEKPKAKRKAADAAVVADGLIADSTAKELHALASSLVKQMKADGKEVDFTPEKGEQGKRANAEFIAKNGS